MAGQGIARQGMDTDLVGRGGFHAFPLGLVGGRGGVNGWMGWAII